MSERHRIARAAAIIGTGTLLSRILGFVRDMVIAKYFGAGMAADAFFVAFRIPNLWRRLVGEGSLTVSFVPVYTEYYTQKGEEESRVLAHVAFSIAGGVLFILTIAGIVFSPVLIRIIAPGFMDTPEKFELTVLLNRIVFPYLFFMGLFALSMGILNSKRHFFAPAIAPIFLNISIIISVLLFYKVFQPAVLTLAAGVLAGGFFQFFFQIPFLLKKGVTFRFNFNFRHPGIKRIGLLMVPGLIGTAVYQMNVFIDTIFASFLPSGSVSYLFYADRLMEFPLGIFAIAIGMAALPSLSELAADRKKEELLETVSFSLRLVSFISVPSMIGLIALRTPIINLLFQRGLFDITATEKTAQALLCFSVGLWAIAAARTIVPAFYALQDTWTPLKIGLVCLGANVIFIVLLIGPLKHAGLALATSLSSTLNLCLLVMNLKPRVGALYTKKNLFSLLRFLICSLPMGACAYCLSSFRGWTASGDEVGKALLLGTAIMIAAFVYGACCYLMKVEELFFVVRMIRRKRPG